MTTHLLGRIIPPSATDTYPGSNTFRFHALCEQQYRSYDELATGPSPRFTICPQCERRWFEDQVHQARLRADAAVQDAVSRLDGSHETLKFES